ncbi:MAG: nucleotidyltransferase family protein, partial [Bacilli bacterium]|nr:nucleotidyltransferase family protein [Bacilli bacterium]
MNHIVGIIFEANPFHKGHQYLIEQVKKDLNPSCIIAITSGYFTMRGEISILSKKEKVQILLDQGIDLVIELPVHQTLNSAHVFGSSSVKYLATCGITDLCFGSECSDLKLFQDVLQLEKTEEFQNKLKQNLKLQHSYKMSYLDTVSEFLPEAKEPLSHANATLALEYLRTLELYPSITPHIYKRKGSSEEDSNLSTFPSGTALRENYLKGIDISSYLPYDSSKLFDLSTYDQHMHALVLALLQKKQYLNQSINGISEGIENYIDYNYQFGLSYEQNIDLLANKK